jgi:hypothetical protein
MVAERCLLETAQDPDDADGERKIDDGQRGVTDRDTAGAGHGL